MAYILIFARFPPTGARSLAISAIFLVLVYIIKLLGKPKYWKQRQTTTLYKTVNEDLFFCNKFLTELLFT